MVKDGKICFAQTADKRDVCILPSMANRHGLIAGATGTGKTVTLKVLAESFSDIGVPVFLADVKGDLAGMCQTGENSPDMQKRIEKFGLGSFSYRSYPVNFWDIFAQKGMPLRTTISEMGPMLLSRLLDLNDVQSDILTVLFKIADDNGWLLIDTKDLKAMLSYVEQHASDYRADYGNITSASIGAIMRPLVALETEGASNFFGEPALDIRDWFTVDSTGKGLINILDSESLINKPRMYATFLLWMLSELFETLPETGDCAKPKMVFFFDEAHLLFKDAPKVLLEKIEQVVKLIRSKGVGIFFVTQNPHDIPDGVLSQLGNKIEHALRAYTPADQKAVKAAADSFRTNPAFDTAKTIMELGTGEAVVSVLDEKGVPTVAERAFVLPPQSKMGAVDDAVRQNVIKGCLLYSKYQNSFDRDSAYEFFKRRGLEDAAAAQKQETAQNQGASRRQSNESSDPFDAFLGTAGRPATERGYSTRTVQSAGARIAHSAERTAAGTIGRQIGRQIGKSVLGSSFGSTLGGNIGASLGRGLLNTLFRL